MKVLVSGGAGFIGSHLVERLVKDGHEVTVIDISKENIERNLKGVNCKIINRDINTRGPMPNSIDWIVHLAALADIVPSIEEPVKYHDTNVSGTLCMLEHAQEWGVKKFIYAASGSCYGNRPPVPTTEVAPMNPQYPYALTKMIGEQYALHWNKVYKVPVTSLRFFNVYGPRSRTTGAYGAVFGVFLAQKLKGKPYTVVGTGSQTRDFLYVSDAVNAICLALDKGKEGEVYNIGSGQTTSIRNLVNHLGGEKVEYIPDRPGEPTCTLAYIAKAQKDLGFQPKVSFAEGVKNMLENIDYWKDAPVWDRKSIEKATKDWFKYLGG